MILSYTNRKITQPKHQLIPNKTMLITQSSMASFIAIVVFVLNYIGFDAMPGSKPVFHIKL